MSASMTMGGRQVFFASGSDGFVWYRWQLQPNGSWSNWSRFNRMAGWPIAVELNTDGRLEVFGLHGDALYHQWQLAPNGMWSKVKSLTGVNLKFSSFTVATNLDGRLELFGSQLNTGALYHSWQMTPGGAWSSWTLLSTINIGTLTTGRDATGRLQLFGTVMTGVKTGVGRADDYVMWQVTPGGAWHPAISFGQDAIGMSVINNKDGREEVFAVNAYLSPTTGKPTKGLLHRYQLTPSGAWSDWMGFGMVGMDAVVPTSNANGHLEVFAYSDTYPYMLAHRWQLTPGGTTWHGWVNIPETGAYSSIIANHSMDGRIQLFANALDGAIWQRWQFVPNGPWTGWINAGFPVI
jgi:hypothetical protein